MLGKPHGDLPTLDDQLSWGQEIDQLCICIIQCCPPHVFAVHGDWGSGKTSFMRQLQWRLGGDLSSDDGSVSYHDQPTETPERKGERERRSVEIATVWFEAWRYQNEAVPVVALLHEMRRQLALAAAVKGKLKKLGAIGIRYILGTLGDVAKTIGVEALVPNAEKIESIGERWEKAHLAETLQTDSIRGLLNEAIKMLLPDGERARLVVFVDDLDRCNSTAAFRLLEGLKIYLNVPRCVFVLGMNEQTLVDAISKELAVPKEGLPAVVQLRAAHYLEKICTNVFRLPPPPDPGRHLGHWLGDAEQAQALEKVIGSLNCLPPNPRRLKALANQWSRFVARAPWPDDHEAQEARAAQVLVAAYIYQFHRDLWERWCFQPPFWKEIKAWCCGELPDDPKARPEWLGALRLPEKRLPGQGTGETWGSSYPDPNAIEIFWIAALVREKSDVLVEQDFISLLRRGNATPGTTT